MLDYGTGLYTPKGVSWPHVKGISSNFGECMLSVSLDSHLTAS